MINTIIAQIRFRLYLNNGKSRYLKMNKLFLLIMAVSLSSCYSSKNLNYLQSDQRSLIVPLNNNNQYLIQSSDVLNIKVQSRDPEQSDFFNITTSARTNIQANPASLFLSGYTVDPEGMITFGNSWRAQG